MNRSKIEWCDYTSNPVKGYCPMACPYCYARRMYDRFGWNKTIRWAVGEMDKIAEIKKPSRIFVGSTIELFGDWIDKSWLEALFFFVRLFERHTFIFLTKQPQNLQAWSPFPENCWVGVSATNAQMAEAAGFWLWEVKAKVKFVSFEPLLGAIPVHFADYISDDGQGISWLIIGAETGNRKEKPPLAQVQGWAKEIIAVADEAGIPVFLKDNLKLPARGEWPK